MLRNYSKWVAVFNKIPKIYCPQVLKVLNNFINSYLLDY